MKPPLVDHPRVRGEHRMAVFSEARLLGSSPRARGAPVRKPAPGLPVGIIPACAGSTFVIDGGTLRRMDHPRVRGEHDLETDAGR